MLRDKESHAARNIRRRHKTNTRLAQSRLRRAGHQPPHVDGINSDIGFVACADRRGCFRHYFRRQRKAASDHDHGLARGNRTEALGQVLQRVQHIARSKTSHLRAELRRAGIRSIGRDR